MTAQPFFMVEHKAAVEQILGALPMGPYEFDAWALTHEFPQPEPQGEPGELLTGGYLLARGKEWHALLDLMIHYGYVYANVITCANVSYEPTIQKVS